ncbi:hypothetical protein F0L17_15735 [Streptomyces sp. TRM43335]|uniref:Uncharacterized protein n=1 Tax=Streptomyces taklimakanensis TaxID=2569853 RepID=A0A6G2BE62_9ACTN|nr:hypothetical protein [Streptomyces taklimakanensis]MTE20530.1 hypothetical protein [Streptomyces taklimakanensis]
MRMDVAAWLSRVTRTAVTAATATVTVTEPGGAAREVSEHHLRADGPLRWSYTVREGGRETHRSCDGRETTHVVGGNPLRSKVPTGSDPTDDPWYFHSWPGVVDGWLVEMLRPVDLLARVVVSAVETTGPDASVRIRATPMGSEPSPYNGFSVPDGRSLCLSLDAERGCFTDVTVTHPGENGPAHRLTHRLTGFE